MTVTTTYDAESDVLYVKRDVAMVARSREAPTDSYLILSRDIHGAVVGFTLLAAREMPPTFWLTHPDRGALPDDLLAALDAWMAARATAR